MFGGSALLFFKNILSYICAAHKPQFMHINPHFITKRWTAFVIICSDAFTTGCNNENKIKKIKIKIKDLPQKKVQACFHCDAASSPYFIFNILLDEFIHEWGSKTYGENHTI